MPETVTNKKSWVPILIGIGAFILGVVAMGLYAEYSVKQLITKLQADEKQTLEEFVINNPASTVKDLLNKYNEINAPV